MLIYKARLAVWNIPELRPQQERELGDTYRPNCVYSHLFLESGFSDTPSDSSIYVIPQSTWDTDPSLPQFICLFGGWRHRKFAGYKVHNLGTQYRSTSEPPNALPNHLLSESLTSVGVYRSTEIQNTAGEAVVFAESDVASWFRVWFFDIQYCGGATSAIMQCGLGASQTACVSAFCSATGRACLITNYHSDEYEQQLYVVDYLSRWDD